MTQRVLQNSLHICEQNEGLVTNLQLKKKKKEETMLLCLLTALAYYILLPHRLLHTSQDPTPAPT